MKQLAISRLGSGGVITNYSCSSRCAHCLYGCSPQRDKGYLEIKRARDIFKKVREMGCSSVHIGGGEPFLNVPGLRRVLETAKNERIGIEYIETNSSWYKEREGAVQILRSLKEEGVSTLLVSISPFHNEYIPFKKVKGVIGACREAGISVFPWVENLYPDLDSFDEETTHSPEEYAARFGSDYFHRIPSRLWIHMGGRALQTFRGLYRAKKTGEILERSAGCGELADVSHFHFDLHGNYIPGLCSGLAIKAEDMGKPVEQETYPFLSILYRSGVSGLVDMAREYGFEPGEEYISKCELCFEVRKYLVLEKGLNSADLNPAGFYSH
ncbi:MAG: radical SAM protein [bacterium]|nr:radical SAM protein [bacterium]